MCVCDSDSSKSSHFSNLWSWRLSQHFITHWQCWHLTLFLWVVCVKVMCKLVGRVDLIVHLTIYTSWFCNMAEQATQHKPCVNAARLPVHVGFEWKCWVIFHTPRPSHRTHTVILNNSYKSQFIFALLHYVPTLYWLIVRLWDALTIG